MNNNNKKNLCFETRHADFYYSKQKFKKEELQAIYDGRKSFYKKAFVIYKDKDTLLLQSYNTIVAHIYKGKFTSYGKYSQTTSRHQKEFEKQFAK